mmetsp:Transcript_10367/g.24010  ORF Transcript_10367/g.24010 Transcript_10367/m.24010 type:complete len:293 (+) Transcript_10367:907-1785(+)
MRGVPRGPEQDRGGVRRRRLLRLPQRGAGGRAGQPRRGPGFARDGDWRRESADAREGAGQNRCWGRGGGGGSFELGEERADLRCWRDGAGLLLSAGAVVGGGPRVGGLPRPLGKERGGERAGHPERVGLGHRPLVRRGRLGRHLLRCLRRGGGGGGGERRGAAGGAPAFAWGPPGGGAGGGGGGTRFTDLPTAGLAAGLAAGGGGGRVRRTRARRSLSVRRPHTHPEKHAPEKKRVAKRAASHVRERVFQARKGRKGRGKYSKQKRARARRQKGGGGVRWKREGCSHASQVP